jgi:hypothetical protein
MLKSVTLYFPDATRTLTRSIDAHGCGDAIHVNCYVTAFVGDREIAADNGHDL